MTADDDEDEDDDDFVGGDRDEEQPKKEKRSKGDAKSEEEKNIDWDRLRITAVQGGMDIKDFDYLALSEVFVYVQAAIDREQNEIERNALLIACIANIAGVKPKVTVDSLLKRKKKQNKDTRSQNAGVAAMLDTLAAPPKKGESLNDRQAKAQFEAFRARLKAAQDSLNDTGRG